MASKYGGGFHEIDGVAGRTDARLSSVYIAINTDLDQKQFAYKLLEIEQHNRYRMPPRQLFRKAFQVANQPFNIKEK
ncbi:hypothetical protein [Desulfosarcina sp.]|uniref:hypothetical protein n=1 Tax=Desulfosarcina sp. TaxID=2027861 RepID=UPI00356A5D92